MDKKDEWAELVANSKGEIRHPRYPSSSKCYPMTCMILEDRPKEIVPKEDDEWDPFLVILVEVHKSIGNVYKTPMIYQLAVSGANKAKLADIAKAKGGNLKGVWITVSKYSYMHPKFGETETYAYNLAQPIGSLSEAGIEDEENEETIFEE